METTNTNDSRKASVLAQLEILRGALKAEPSNAVVTQALNQCDRLQLAITQFHAEGLRFAAFTVLRLSLTPGTSFGEPVRKAAADLKRALDSAGYPH